MVKDAESNSEADQKRRALAEIRNHAEASIHQTEKSISDLCSDVPAADKEAAEKAIVELKAAIDGDSVDVIQNKMNELQQVSMKIGEVAYRKSQEKEAGTTDTENRSSSNAGSSDKESGDSEVIDADFTNMQFEDDENDKKKSDGTTE